MRRWSCWAAEWAPVVLTTIVSLMVCVGLAVLLSFLLDGGLPL